MKKPIDKRAAQLAEEYPTKYCIAAAMVGIEADVRLLEAENQRLDGLLSYTENSLKNAIAKINQLQERAGSY